MAKTSGKTNAKPRAHKAKSAHHRVKAPSSRLAVAQPRAAAKPNQPAPSVVPTDQKLASVWRLTSLSAVVLWRYKRVLGGITLVYAALSVLLIQSLISTTNVANLKTQFLQTATGQYRTFTSSLSVFGSLLGSGGSSGTDNSTAVYQLVLTVAVSLGNYLGTSSAYRR